MPGSKGSAAARRRKGSPQRAGQRGDSCLLRTQMNDVNIIFNNEYFSQISEFSAILFFVANLI